MKKVLLLAVIVILNCTSAHTQTITNTTWSVYNTASDLVYLYHFGTDTGYMSTDFINYNAISIFTDNGHDMVITDIPGAPMACTTTDSGYFTYVILNDTVNFQVVSDPCTVRQLNLTQYHWVISTTNIEDLSKPPVICLFPNPSKDGIYHLSIMNNNFDLISIYSQEGKIIMQKTLSISGNVEYDIDLSNIASGIYILTISGNEGYKSLKLLRY